MSERCERKNERMAQYFARRASIPESFNSLCKATDNQFSATFSYLFQKSDRPKVKNSSRIAISFLKLCHSSISKDFELIEQDTNFSISILVVHFD